MDLRRLRDSDGAGDETKPYPAYEGTLPYAFVSYAHRDADQVMPVIRGLQDKGFRIWYDRIELGERWDDEIKEHLERSSIFVCFLSEAYGESSYCYQELNKALGRCDYARRPLGDDAYKFVSTFLDGSFLDMSLLGRPTPENPVLDGEGMGEGWPDDDTRLYLKQAVLRLQGYQDGSADALEAAGRRVVELSESLAMQPCKDIWLVGKTQAGASVLRSYQGGSRVPHVPSEVEEIGSGAFNTPNATRIALPAGVYRIGDHAFVGCGMLREVALPDRVSYMGKGAFWKCHSLEEIAIPRKVEMIEDRTFENCLALRKVSFQGGKLQSIGVGAFADCISLDDVELPSSLKRMGVSAFRNCRSLRGVVVPRNVAFGDDCWSAESAFEGCISLESAEVLAQSELVPAAFLRGCVKLARVVLARGIQRIGREAFGGCAGLRELELPEGLTAIDESAFLGCRSLRVMALPLTLTSLGKSCFEGSGLKQVVIPPTVDRVSARALKGCESLERVLGMEGVKSLGHECFSGCTSLKEVSLGDSLEEIGANAFMGCRSLEELELEDTNVRRLGAGAFSGCSALKSCSLPMRITRIERGAFYGCGSLERIVLPEGLTKVGKDAFKGCTALSEVVFPSTLESVEERAFAGCTALRRVDVPRRARYMQSTFEDSTEVIQV